MSSLIRYQCNTLAAETPKGELTWRIMLEQGDGFEVILVKHLIFNMPSFSLEDEIPTVGRKYPIACRGILHVEEGIGRMETAWIVKRHKRPVKDSR